MARLRVSAPARLRGAALALLLPFLGFSLLSPGTMLAPDALGRVMVVLCGDAQPMPMAVAADGSLTPLSDPAHPAAGHAPCGWAAHAQPALDPPPLLLPAAIQPQHRPMPVATVARVAPLRGPDGVRARGPPDLS